MSTANKENPLCSFTSTLCACPASSSSMQCIFSIYDLVCYKFRKSLHAKKAEKLVKMYRLCRVEEDNHQNLLKLFYLFFTFYQVFLISLLFDLKKRLQLTVQVCCLFYFLLSRFFEGKAKSWFFGVFLVVFFDNFF